MRMEEEIENLNEQVAERAGQRFSGRLLMTHSGVTALATDLPGQPRKIL